MKGCKMLFFIDKSFRLMSLENLLCTYTTRSKLGNLNAFVLVHVDLVALYEYVVGKLKKYLQPATRRLLNPCRQAKIFQTSSLCVFKRSRHRKKSSANLILVFTPKPQICVDMCR